MRILEIALCNLASLKGEFRIPLDQPPFSRDGLFAIRGVTGSGKSTLIDAICLALFDDTPRTLGRGGPEIGTSDQKDRLRAKDPRNLLHRGTAHGFAEVIFRGADGHRWRSRWSVSRARKKADGRFQTQEMELENLDTGERLGGKRTEVLPHIERRVGLSFDQFKRSVILAQGEFAAFVRASEEERAGLLEAMTGTDIYARVSMAAHRRNAQEEQKLKELHIQRDALGLLSDEERQAKTAQQEEIQGQIRSKELDQSQIQLHLAWYEKKSGLARSLEDAADKSAKAQGAFAAAEERRARFSQVEKAQALRPFHQERARAEKHRQELEQQLSGHQEAMPAAEQNLLQQEQALLEKRQALQAAVTAQDEAKPALDAARVLDTQLAELSRQCQQSQDDALSLGNAAALAEEERDRSIAEEVRLASDLAVVKNALLESSVFESLARAWDRIHGDLEAFAGTKSSLASTRKALDLTEQKSKAAEKALTALNEEHQSLANGMEGLKGECHALAQRMAQEPRELLDKARREAQEVLDRHRRLESILQRLEPLQAQRLRVERDLKTQTEGLEAAAQALENAQQALPMVEAALREAKAALELAQAAMSLEERRHHLQDGQPCPLCGALEHPWAKGSPMAGLIKAQQAKVDALEKEKAELDKTLAQAQAHVDQARQALERLSQEREECEARLKKGEMVWRESLQGLEGLPEDPFSQVAASLVRDRILEAEEALARITARETALLALENQNDDLQKELRALESKIAALDERKGRAEEECRRLGLQKAEQARDLAHLEAEFLRQRESLAGILTPPFLDSLDNDPLGLQARLARGVQERLNAEQAQADLERQTQELAKVLEGQRAKALEKRSTASDADIKRQSLLQSLEALKTQRQAYFDGRSVFEVERGLSGARQICEIARDQAQKAHQEAERQMAERRKAVNMLQEQVAGSVTVLEEARRAFDDAILRHWCGDLSTLEACLPALEACLAWSQDQIRLERESLQSLESACSQAKAVMDQYQQSLEAHELSGRPVNSQEELASLAAEAKASIQAMQLALGGLQSVMAQDDIKRQDADVLAQAILEQQSTASLWKEMNDLIGSSDGKKFRTFAQSLTLEALLVFANEQLSRLTPRYRLQRVPGCELELQVVDQDMGDEIRALNSLSGGETFLVSLGLALGLSSLSSSDMPIESLFIDEGFGTLDSELLETALSVLDELQAQGRQVGIISHVDGLATHIPTQIHVQKLGGGKSRVVLPLGGCASGSERSMSERQAVG